MHDRPATTRARRRLGWHVLLCAAALAVIWAVVRPTTSFTTDEGAYGAQADSLLDGSWEYEYQAAALDPDGEFFPLKYSTSSERGSYAYVRHPAYPIVVAGAAAAFGRGGGVLLPGMVGALVAAVGAWFLAARLRPGSEPCAFWLTAASPLAFNALVLWGHTLAAAGAALAVVAVAAALTRPSPSWLYWAGAAAAVVGTVLVRSEGFLFGMALGAAAVVIGLVSRARAAVVGGGGAILLVTAVTAFAERAWVSAITGGGAGRLEARSSSTGGRLEGVWRSLAHGVVNDPDGAAFALLAGVLGVYGAVVLLRARRLTGPATIALAGAGAAYAGRLVAAPADPIAGLLLAWPIAVVAAGVGIGRIRREPVALLVTVTVGLFAGAVLLTQYPDGGGLQWGGRFLTPAVPLLAALAAAVLSRLPRREAIAAAVALAVVPTSCGLVILREARAEQAEVDAAVRAADADLYLSGLIHQPRLMWRDELPWMAVPVEDMGEVLDRAAAAGVESVTLVLPQEDEPDAPCWDADSEVPVRGGAVRVVHLEPARTCGD
ncbi:MAG: hypothetical protein ACRD0G_09975 [Acidimicrobiales bacterium]